MPYRPGRPFLHTPGPTHIPEPVLNAMRRQPLDLADPEFLAICKSCIADLKPVFGTTGDVVLYAANGHGGWEAVLANLFAPGDRLLIPEAGVFSASLREHAGALGIDVTGPSGSWRRAIDPQAVEDALRADTERTIKAVFVVHIDTGTGIASDLEAIRAAIDAAGHPALYLVDAVASLAAAPFAMDAWRIDVAVTASQKALMSPPGLAMVAFNGRALEVARGTPALRRYWDWEFRSTASNYRMFGGTAPEQTLFALRAALDLIAEQGLEAIFARHRRLAGAVQAAVECWCEAGALSFNALVPEERAVAVTTVLTPDGFNAEDLRSHVRETLGVSIAGGLRKLEGRAFRIGHLGDLNEPMVLGCLGAVETALIELGIPHGRGGLDAAVRHLAKARAGIRKAAE